MYESGVNFVAEGVGWAILVEVGVFPLSFLNGVYF